MKKSGIYRIQCLVSMKSYIGHSTNLNKREKTHFSELRINIHKNTHLQNAWNEYGEENFHFSILEVLPNGLSKLELEAIETKWVLQFNTHKCKFGYNACLPGNYPLKEKDENITKQKIFKLVAINMFTKEIQEFDNAGKAGDILGVSPKKINSALAYWKDLTEIIPNSFKSCGGYVFVKASEYIEDFNYIGHRKPRKKKPIVPKRTKKKSEDIIPIENRNLKRVPIVAINCETGEEIPFDSISKAVEVGYSSTKIYKCLKNPKYKHHGCYFKYVNKLLIEKIISNSEK